MNKFYNFISKENEYKLMLYGAISDEKYEESDVVFSDFKDMLDSMPNGATLNIEINSPGGSVFCTNSIIVLLSNAKRDRNIKITADIIFGASCASWITMVADEINVYENSSMIMVHLPMNGYMFAYLNRKDMEREIEVLSKIEEQMIGHYLSKAKDGVTKEQLMSMLEAETWMTGEEFAELFECNLIPTTRKMVACLDKDVFQKYKNVPSQLLLTNKEDITVEENIKDEVIEETVETVENTAEVEEVTETEEVVNETTDEVEDVENAKKKKRKCELEETISNMQETINALTNEKSELETKLNESNEKVMALNDRISELQPIVDEYNNELAKAKEIEDKKLLDEKKTYYKDKFEKLGARAKFEGEEVQNLLANCLKDEKAQSTLNLMIVDMISIEEKKTVNKVEQISKIENLIPSVDTIEEKYGFR